VGSRLVIPKYHDLREQLFWLTHDHLGHFRGKKSYVSLRDEFYWPNMRRDLLMAYVPGCADCQRNKLHTHKTPGPLHPLPIPDNHFDSVAIDFIGPLPMDEGCDQIVTMTDRLGSDVQIAACSSKMNAEGFANLFFNTWFCENRCPLEIVSNQDKLFISVFWRSLTKLAGIKLKLSTAYHPQTDGALECTNKTVIQCLKYHVG
jgi:hypothetical protein